MIYQHIYTRCNRGYYSHSDGYDTAAKSADLSDLVIRGSSNSAFLRYPDTYGIPNGAKPKITSYAEADNYYVYNAACEPSVKYGMNAGRIIYFVHQYFIDKQSTFMDDPEKMLLGTDFLDNYDEVTSGSELLALNTLPSCEYTALADDITVELGLKRNAFMRFADSVKAAVSGEADGMLILLDLPPEECSRKAKRIMAVIELMLPPSLRKAASFCTFWSNFGTLGTFRFVFSSHSIFANTPIPQNIRVFDFGAIDNTKMNESAYPYAALLWESIKSKEQLKRTAQRLERPRLAEDRRTAKFILDVVSNETRQRSQTQNAAQFEKLGMYIKDALTKESDYDGAELDSLLNEFLDNFDTYAATQQPETLAAIFPHISEEQREELVNAITKTWADALANGDGHSLQTTLDQLDCLTAALTRLSNDYPEQYTAFFVENLNACMDESGLTALMQRMEQHNPFFNEKLKMAICNAIERVAPQFDQSVPGRIGSVINYAKEVNTSTSHVFGAEVFDSAAYFLAQFMDVDIFKLDNYTLEKYSDIAADVYTGKTMPDKVKAMAVLRVLCGEGSFTDALLSYNNVCDDLIRTRLQDKMQDIIADYDYPKDFALADPSYCSALMLSNISFEHHNIVWEDCFSYIRKQKHSTFPFAAEVILDNSLFASNSDNASVYICDAINEAHRKSEFNDSNWRRMAAIVKDCGDTRAFIKKSSARDQETMQLEKRIAADKLMRQTANALIGDSDNKRIQIQTKAHTGGSVFRQQPSASFWVICGLAVVVLILFIIIGFLLLGNADGSDMLNLFSDEAENIIVNESPNTALPAIDNGTLPTESTEPDTSAAITLPAVQPTASSLPASTPNPEVTSDTNDEVVESQMPVLGGAELP